MKNGIRISPTHGLNPSMSVCFFCGEPKGIALFGKLKNDAEAPMNCVMDYEPCDSCKEHMKEGITLIEVTEVVPPDGRPPMKVRGNVSVYPTGSLCVLKTESFHRIFPSMAPDLKEGSEVCVDHEVFRRIISE